MITVRAALPEDEMEWRLMWAGYIQFYEASIPDSVTSATWRRIHDENQPFGAVIAADGSRTLGFANYVLHPYTWSEHPRCLMEDLFVKQEARGRGLGRAIIEHLVGLCKSQGWTDLFWITKETNATARRLYDQFTPADGFIQYKIEVDAP